MKKKSITFHARWEYSVSNIIGLVIAIAVAALCFYASSKNGIPNIRTVWFWVGMLLVLFVPFGLITLFSSIKSVIADEKGLIILYRFKKHRSEITFAEVRALKLNGVGKNPNDPSLRESFTLELQNGKMFDFSRSQFNEYGKLKSICQKSVH
jgi:hypothetical protein